MAGILRQIKSETEEKLYRYYQLSALFSKKLQSSCVKSDGQILVDGKTVSCLQGYPMLTKDLLDNAYLELGYESFIYTAIVTTVSLDDRLSSDAKAQQAQLAEKRLSEKQKPIKIRMNEIDASCFRQDLLIEMKIPRELLRNPLDQIPSEQT